MASVGRCRIDAPTPLAITASTDAIASFEKRGTDVASTSARRSPAKASSTSSPASPPIQSEPDTRCTQSKVSESAAGEVCAACPASPGTASMAPPASTAPTIASSAAIDRAPVAAVDPDRDRRRQPEQGRHDLQVDQRPPQRR